MAFCINHRQILFALSSDYAHSRGESYTAVCVQRETERDRDRDRDWETESQRAEKERHTQRDRESQRAERVKGQRERERDAHTNLRSSTQIQKLINNQYSFLNLSCSLSLPAPLPIHVHPSTFHSHTQTHLFFRQSTRFYWKAWVNKKVFRWDLNWDNVGAFLRLRVAGSEFQGDGAMTLNECCLSDLSFHFEILSSFLSSLCVWTSLYMFLN